MIKLDNRAMVATLGVIIGESATGVSWVDAGKVELDGARYLNFDLPFSISQICWIETISVGAAELYRNSELDPEKRIYPGGRIKLAYRLNYKNKSNLILNIFESI